MSADVRERISPLEPLRCEWLAGSGGRIGHAFFTRRGGVSSGVYAGLNAGVGSRDDTDKVMRNRALVTRHLGVEDGALACPHQVHSAEALLVDAPFERERPKADAVVTARPGLAVGVLTADCGPVLFCDGKAGVVAAAHAGWKGALSGILESTIDVMEKAGARRQGIRAALGPTISQANYEVGPELVERFHEADGENARFFRPSVRTGRMLFDLSGFILRRLADAGVTAVSLDACTYADESRFYSYRRSVHRNEPDYGRQISAIVLKEP